MNFYNKFTIALVSIGFSVSVFAAEKLGDKITPRQRAETIFSVLDTINPSKTIELYTEDSLFVYGNSPAITGKDAIFKEQASFFSSIKAMKHTIKRVWTGQDTLVAEMTVTYQRHDGSFVSLPVTDVLVLKNGKISATHVYMDIAPLFNPKP